MFAEEDERFPRELIAKILLELYQAFSVYDPQRGKVLRRTLAACRLVCRRWSTIVTVWKRRFSIGTYRHTWKSPSFSWYMLQRTPLPLTGEDGSNQGGNAGWLPENYTTALSRYHPRFLLDIVPNVVPGFFGRMMWKAEGGYHRWVEEPGSVIRSTLAACCLVCREWNRAFTPILYADIFLGGKKSLLTRSLLHRTFQHTRPTHIALVRTITIEPAEDGSTANLLSTSFIFSFPNLHKLILRLWKIDPAALHPNFAQNLRSLSRSCTVQLGGDTVTPELTWELLPHWVRLIRHSLSTSYKFIVDNDNSDGEYLILFIVQECSINHQDIILSSDTYFYIGKQEALAHGFSSDDNIGLFQQHLIQTGHDLKALSLQPYEPFLPPGKCAVSLPFPSL